MGLKRVVPLIYISLTNSSQTVTLWFYHIMIVNSRSITLYGIITCLLTANHYWEIEHGLVNFKWKRKEKLPLNSICKWDEEMNLIAKEDLLRLNFPKLVFCYIWAIACDKSRQHSIGALKCVIATCLTGFYIDKDHKITIIIMNYWSWWKDFLSTKTEKYFNKRRNKSAEEKEIWILLTAH